MLRLIDSFVKRQQSLIVFQCLLIAAEGGEVETVASGTSEVNWILLPEFLLKAS